MKHLLRKSTNFSDNILLIHVYSQRSRYFQVRERLQCLKRSLETIDSGMKAHFSSFANAKRQRPAANYRRVSYSKVLDNVTERVPFQPVFGRKLFPGLLYFGLFSPFHEAEG